MNYSLFITTFVSTFLFVASDTTSQEVSKSSAVKINELNWIAGNWSGDANGTITEEQWLEPRAGMMIGMNRMVFPNGKGTFEFLRIAETENGIAYFASPNGKPATSFALKELSKSKVVFENKAHDFPQRIIYERLEDTMMAMIEGEVNGKAQSMKWTWKRPSLPK